MTKLLRVPEVATRLAIGRSTIYLLVERGQLPSVRIGSAVRIPEAELDAWVKARTREPAQEDRVA